MASPDLSYPDPYILRPIGKHKSTIILLHGTSQDGKRFGEALLSISTLVVDNRARETSTQNVSAEPPPENFHSSPELTAKILPDLFPHTRFVFPTGRQRHSTVLGGPSHAWFDFASFSDRVANESLQIPGLAESSIYLSSLVDAEVDVLLAAQEAYGEAGSRSLDEKHAKARQRIVVGGFSQGSAMASIALLTGALGSVLGGGSQIGGFVGLSGWLPFRLQILDLITNDTATTSKVALSHDAPAKNVSAAMKFLRLLLGLDDGLLNSKLDTDVTVQKIRSIPVFLGHGQEDAKMLPKWGREMGELLKEMPFQVQMKSYEGLGHWWSTEEVQDLVVFLKGVWDDRGRVF